MTPKELAALIALAAVWGGSFLFIRIAVPAFGPIPLVAARVGLAGLLLWAGLRLSGRRISFTRAQFGRLLLLGALNAAVPFALIATAELRLSASMTAILNATVPIFTTLPSAIWLGWRLTAPRATGLLLGVFGVGVLVGWSPVALTGGTVAAIGATLVACLCYAFAGVYAKRELSSVPPATLALGQQLGALAWLFVPAVLQLPRHALPAPAVFALVGLAALSTSLAYVLYFYLNERVGPVATASVTYLLPIFGSLWGALFLHERLTRGMFGGLACILGSVVLLNGVRLFSGKGRGVRQGPALAD